jgi:hypothetical protein
VAEKFLEVIEVDARELPVNRIERITQANWSKWIYVFLFIGAVAACDLQLV